jgi:hypothetical protein
VQNSTHEKAPKHSVKSVCAVCAGICGCWLLLDANRRLEEYWRDCVFAWSAALSRHDFKIQRLICKKKNPVIRGMTGFSILLAETEGFEPSMRLYTPYSLSRGAPSATRSRFQQGVLCLNLGGRLVQIESFVQRAHGEFHVLLVDHYRCLDFRRRDHLDVDALFAQ